MKGHGLNVWLNGELIGQWSIVRGEHVFSYSSQWVASANSMPISLSLPITPTLQVKGAAVSAYFENLLPDDERIRARTGRYFGVSRTDAYALLEAIGRDCVGAIQLLAQGQAPAGYDTLNLAPLHEAKIAQLLRQIPSWFANWQEIDKEFFRLSLAGAQNKTALTLLDGKWYRPEGATPSTHIMKLPITNNGFAAGVSLFDTIANEWICSKIVQALGLPIAKTEIVRFEDQCALSVERFDRKWQDDKKWILRIPQEDFCQALGVFPNMKYESDGGPGIKQCMNLLTGSDNPEENGLFFQLTLLTYWLMAAIDGHAKNYSIFPRSDKKYTMTPLYDVLSVWPYVGDGHNQLHHGKIKQAMALRSKNAHYKISEIYPRHWHALAHQYGGECYWNAMIALVERVDSALNSVQQILPNDFPQRIWDPISSRMSQQAREFLALIPQETHRPISKPRA